MNYLLTIPAILISQFGSKPDTENMTVVYNENSGYVEIKYILDNTPEKETVTLQRSNNNINWKDISTQKAKRNSLNFTDRNPTAGKTWYRFKLLTKKNILQYSSTCTVLIHEPKDDWVVFPNPVQDELKLQYKGVQSIKGVLNVFIYTSNGNILRRKRFASNQRTLQIPVQDLARGIYTVRIYVQDELVGFEQFSKM